MDIVLLGYMGSGKTTVGKELADLLAYDFLDLDHFIEAKENQSISELFRDKGEIYFRKIEHVYLKELLQFKPNTPRVIALGGGTPCYANNIDLVATNPRMLSFYLLSNYKNLAARLWNEKDSRPIVSNVQSLIDLEDFIRKHLFERQYYYLQADHKINVDEKKCSTIVQEIINLYHEKNN